ncbi:hypothetical protein [Glaciihabitans arcticus]|nr:hypothetical protein [Glaciihabitans arcticus]
MKPRDEFFDREARYSLGVDEECRRHKRDDLLMIQPGMNRGTAV